jgi:carbon storage regulator
MFCLAHSRRSKQPGKDTLMLVLRRKVGERLVIAGVITITVLEIDGSRVKLGLSAPPEVSVVREELIGTPRPSSLPPQQR